MKDRLTLLMCGNASGDFKVNPLLVYHTDNPPVLKRHNVMKSKSSVMWRANALLLDNFSPSECMKFLLQVQKISYGKRISIKMPPVA